MNEGYLNSEDDIKAAHDKIVGFLQRENFLEIVQKEPRRSDNRKKAAENLLNRIYKSTQQSLNNFCIDMGFKGTGNGSKIINQINNLLDNQCKDIYHVYPSIQVFTQSRFSKNILCHFACATATIKSSKNSKKYPTDIITLDEAIKRGDSSFAEKTYLNYRDVSCPLLYSAELISHLEKRYNCEAMNFGSAKLPVTVLWRNADKLISPNEILGEFDRDSLAHFNSSPVFNPNEYVKARNYIREQYEGFASPVQYEGCNYRMIEIDLSQAIPQIKGAYGFYYDNILTQYAMEWELKKGLNQGSDLNQPGTLPLREAIEKNRNPLIDGNGRCAAITISTLIVFKRNSGEYCTIIRRRSSNVGVSSGLYHVVPAGMFESPNAEDKWCIETNIWRELLEEVYSEKEQIGDGISCVQDHLRSKPPINVLIDLIEKEKAELSITGICCDLLNLRPEICTILYVDDPSFPESRKMVLNWEYEKEGPTGKFAIRWNNIDEFERTISENKQMVVTGAACLCLGRKWLLSQHNI